MKHFLLVGASSAIAQSTKSALLDKGYEVTQLSRNQSVSDYELTDYLSVLPAIDTRFDGIVYFPGSINLKPFRSLKLEDFQSDFNIHVLGAVHVLKTYQSNLNEGASLSLIHI